MELITNVALEAGFTGGLVVDYPHSTKAKKYYLFLQAGETKETLDQVISTIPKNEEIEDNEVVEYKTDKQTVRNRRKNNKKAAYKSRDWILKKKQRQRKQGRDVRKDTKYTGRKRRGHGC